MTGDLGSVGVRQLSILTVGNMYPPHHQGGYELVWRDLVLALRARGHRVRVLCSDHREHDPRSGLGEDPEIRRELRWYWRDGEFPPLSGSEIVELERHNRRRFFEQIGELYPDLILWGPMGGMSMSLPTQNYETPDLAFVIDEWLTYGPKVDPFWRRTHAGGPLGHLRALAARVTRPVHPGRAISRIAFGSQTLRRNAAGLTRGAEQVSVITPGVELDRFAHAPRRPEASTTELLCVGRLDPRKGFRVAVEALAGIPGARLRIATAGESPHEAELRELANRLGVADRLTIDRPARDEMPEVYARADVVLFPVQWEEPWGLVPLEAMAVGRPVVASGTGGSGEFLEHEANCLLYEPRGDAAALGSAVERIAGEPGLADRLVTAGRRTAEQHSAAAWCEAIADLCERTAGDR